MIQFYAPDIEKTLTLPESDSGHAVRVLRMRSGDEMQVIDGKGNIFKCVLEDAHPKHVGVSIVDKQYLSNHWRCKIELAVAPTKHIDRMEWLVEKVVEIGVDRIIPLRCDRSERKEIKHERLQKIAVSAMKQSLKTVLPQVEEMMPIKIYLSENFNGLKYFCYCDSNIPRVIMSKDYRASQNVRILIGPEGDFSASEADYAQKSGYIPVSLGESRLRTETAGIFALTQIHTLLGL